MEEKNYSKKLKSLSILLLISTLCLIGITVYASNWEQVAQIDWKEEFRQTTKAVKERVFPGPEILEVGYEMTDMSHAMPVLMTTLEAGDGMIPVPLISQEECGYQTGCELVSGAMLLNYYEMEVTPQELYEVIAKVSSPMNADGTGVDPREYFIGDPRKAGGYGCYAGTLTTAMNQVTNDEWYATNISGTTLKKIEEEYLSRGTPVIIWATIHMMEPKVGNHWLLQDGTDFQWWAGEHCLVLVGADDNYYYFNDPNYAGEVIGYERATVEERFRQMGKQAIIVSR